ncbi:MAG: host attachment protein [Alphaproteobacteria bacterium]
MKPIVTLYLLLNDEDYRLVHTHEEGLSEISHTKAELAAAGVAHGTGHSPQNGVERSHLAKHAAKVLAAEWAKGRYDRIVIAAGPKMLGEFRHDLPKALAAHVASELHKDLIKVPLHDLPSHFAEVSAV